jgi:hypothetical protein
MFVWAGEVENWLEGTKKKHVRVCITLQLQQLEEKFLQTQGAFSFSFGI